jgi:acetate kinase
VSSIKTLLLSATQSTLRFQLRDGKKVTAAGRFARLGTASAIFEVTTDDEPYSESVRCTNHRQAMRTLIDYLQRNSVLHALADITLVVHRVPHGGTLFRHARLMTRDDVHKLEHISFLSLDLPSSVTLLLAAMSQLSCPHVAVFDTGLTATLPLEAAMYPIPPKMAQQFHLRRYGFHGILHKGAYDAACEQWRKRPKRTLSIKISDDVSIVALLDGVAVDTTTGFTSAEGLPGLYRTGSLDPRIPLHFATHLRADPHHIDLLFSTRCGIAGMTGKTSYKHVFEGAKAEDAACVDALMMLAYRIAQSATGMAASLGGLDAIVFSGDADTWPIQEEVCHRLAFLGVAVQRTKQRIVSKPRSKVKVLAVSVTEEELLLAEGIAALGDKSLKRGRKQR